MNNEQQRKFKEMIKAGKSFSEIEKQFAKDMQKASLPKEIDKLFGSFLNR